MTQVQVYVGTYGKYNNGSIEGKWLDVSDYSDKEEFLEACAELHEDEEDPEFMFQDIEAPEYLSHLISESHIDDELWEALEAVEGMSIEEDVLEAYIYCFGTNGKSIADLISEADDAFCGEFDSDAAFAEDYAEQTGAIDSNATWPQNCIDWDWAARDLMIDHHERDGYYFRSY